MEHRATNTTPYLFRYSRLIRIRWALSGPTLLGTLGLTSSYVIRGATSSTSQPVVALGDQYMVWPIAFGVVSLVLVLALVTRRRLEQAHVLAGAALGGYGAALLWATATTGVGWPTASLAIAGALTSLTAAAVYTKGR